MADFPAWQQGVCQDYPPLRGTLHADVAIVGGGLAGVTTALMLQHSGVKTVLLEARRLGQGASFGCGGLLTCHSPEVYAAVANTMGMDAARTLAQLLREAVHGVGGMIRGLHIPCAAEEASLYLYAETSADLSALEKHLRLMQQLDLSLAQAPDAGGCPFPVELSAVAKHQALLLPLPYLLGLAEDASRQGCIIHEHTPVLRMEGTRLRTPGGVVTADRVILCTGVPLGCRHLPLLALLESRLREARLLRTEHPLLYPQLSVQADEMTLRPVSGGMLMTFDRGTLGVHTAERSRIIRNKTLRALLPDATTADVILRREVFTRDGMPLIGPVKPQDGRVLMAGGFSGLGLAGSFLAARVLTGSILTRPLPEASLFRPFRSYKGKWQVQLQGLAQQGRAYIRGWMHPRTPRCPHMGCPLRYNPENRRWECPCHGSTFDVMGQVESAPALRDASLSPRDRPST